jgi:prevent-host-death family protein
MRVIPFTKFRPRFSHFVDNVYHTKNPCIITKWGKCVIAIVPMEMYERMREMEKVSPILKAH